MPGWVFLIEDHCVRSLVTILINAMFMTEVYLNVNNENNIEHFGRKCVWH